MTEKIKRKSTYKPLLFTTTVRNPERIKWMLGVLKDYNGRKLTNELAVEIEGELIRNGLYKPTELTPNVREKIKNGEPLTNEEVKKVLEENPQEHKEAGFNRGWPSRFDTHFKISKELGFVFYKMGEKIEFSDIGLKFADNEHPEFEQQAFLNAFVKYQSNNPFRRVLNENVPLILLLSVIKKINNNPKFNNSGITRQEIPLILCWKDNNSEALYQKIVQIRSSYGYKPSNEVILSICDELTNGRHNSMKDVTIMQELPDEFIRKMRLTGLITIRGFGAFIDLNKKELEKVDYVLGRYTKYEKYESERDYFNYLSQIDENLVQVEIEYVIDIEQENKLLIKWTKHYTWDDIKSEILNFNKSNFSSKDEILRFIPGPLRLEFLTSLAVLTKYPKIRLIPNYITDDEGLPSAHAPGNRADIECYEKKNCTLLEVTLLNGTAQVAREMPPISRHLTEKKEEFKNSISFFVAPKIHKDTIKWSEFIKYKDDLDIFTFSINEFVEELEREKPELYLSN